MGFTAWKHSGKFALVLLMLGSFACNSNQTTSPAGENADSAKVAEPEKPKEQENPKAPEKPKEQDYVNAVCSKDEFIGCYEQLKVNGSIDGNVVVDIAADGTVASVTYTGSAPKPVQDCIIGKVEEKKKVEGFEGDPLQATCSYSGSLNNGIRMVMWSSDYKRVPPQ